MRQTIYVDVLLGINLFINYFTLLATSRFLYMDYKRIRIFLGSLLGAFYSLYIFFPKPYFIFSILIKLLMVISIIAVTFWGESIRMQIKGVLYFWGINVAFSGIMFAIWCLYAPRGLIINNSVVYFNISPIVLLGSTVIAYTMLELFSRIAEKKETKDTLCKVHIETNGKKLTIGGKVDTGNSLKEPFSNLPVIVVRRDKILDVIPNGMMDILDGENSCDLSFMLNDKWRKKIRMVPFRTVSGDGILPAFKPDSVEIERKKSKFKKSAYIAICKESAIEDGISSLISPELID